MRMAAVAAATRPFKEMLGSIVAGLQAPYRLELHTRWAIRPREYPGSLLIQEPPERRPRTSHLNSAGVAFGDRNVEPDHEFRPVGQIVDNILRLRFW